MKAKKVVLSALIGAFAFASSNLLALKGTAVREVVNYAGGKVEILDSNEKTFTIGAAGTYLDGNIKPTKAFYTRTTDIEIKQNTQKPTIVTVYGADGSVMAQYTLSDFDWRVWHVVDFLRSQDIALDKTHLKALWKAYRRGLILKPLKMLWELISEVSKTPDIDEEGKTEAEIKKEKDKATSEKVENIIGILDPEEVKELTDKPPTKDARLYILPDGSMVMGSDDPGSNLDAAVQHIVSTNPTLPEGRTYADLVEDEKATHTFTVKELKEVDEITQEEADDLEAILEDAIDELEKENGIDEEDVERAKILMIESGEYTPEEQAIIERVD